MPVRTYRELLAHREVRLPLLFSVLERVAPGMIVLSLVLVVRDAGYAYTVAGLVTAAHQIGVGTASPLQGRLADRFGQHRVLRPDAAAYLTGTSLLAWAVVTGVAVPWLLLLALLTGAVYPPTTSCVRVALSNRFRGGRERETSFALVAVAVEVGFIVGPLAAIAVTGAVGARWAVVLAGAMSALGASGLSTTTASRAVPPRQRGAPRRSALGSPGVRVMVVALGTIAVAFGVVDVTVPAVAELAGDRDAAGWLIASIAAGSLLGGLVYGGRVWPGTVVDRLRVLATIFALGFVAIPFATGSLPVFAVVLFLAGLFLAPMTICAFEVIDDRALPGTQTEAQQWTQALVVVGVALGAALSGVAVDLGGPPWAFVAGSVFIVTGALMVNLRRGRLVATDDGAEVARPVA